MSLFEDLFGVAPGSIANRKETDMNEDAKAVIVAGIICFTMGFLSQMIPYWLFR